MGRNAGGGGRSGGGGGGASAAASAEAAANARAAQNIALQQAARPIRARLDAALTAAQGNGPAAERAFNTAVSLTQQYRAAIGRPVSNGEAQDITIRRINQRQSGRNPFAQQGLTSWP